MIKYTLKELDFYNFRLYKIPQLPKYNNLSNFIYRMNQVNDNQMNRNNFGDQAPKTYFKPASSIDDVVKGRINELMSKITEDNQAEILDQFQQLSFDQITNHEIISHTIHNSIVNCFQYHEQFLELLKFLYDNHGNFNESLKTIFLNYDKEHLDELENSEIDIENKFRIKQKIVINYEMIILLLKNEILFEMDDIAKIISYLESLTKTSAIEIFIRFLKILKTQEIKIDRSIIDNLGQKISNGSYPKRIEFLVMDLA